MTLFHWVLNIFSLSTCFGALLVLGILLLWLRKTGVFLVFLTVFFLSMSYGSGILLLLKDTGLSAPDIRQALLFSYSFTPLTTISYISDFSLLLILPQIPRALFGRKERWTWYVLIPLIFLGYVLPLIPWQTGGGGEVELLRFSLIGVGRVGGYILAFLYAMSAPIRFRSEVPVRIKRFIIPVLAYFTFVHFPLMILEDVLMLSGIIPSYNTVEALGFLGLTSFTIIITLVYLIRNQAVQEPSIEKLSRDWGLTAREEEVMTHLVGGRAYKEIAAALNISLDTVKTHASSIYRKTGSPGKQALKYMILDKAG